MEAIVPWAVTQGCLKMLKGPHWRTGQVSWPPIKSRACFSLTREESLETTGLIKPLTSQTNRSRRDWEVDQHSQLGQSRACQKPWPCPHPAAGLTMAEVFLHSAFHFSLSLTCLRTWRHHVPWRRELFSLEDLRLVSNYDLVCGGSRIPVLSPR